MNKSAATVIAAVAISGSFAAAGTRDVEVCPQDLVTIHECDQGLSSMDVALSHDVFAASLEHTPEPLVVAESCNVADFTSSQTTMATAEQLPVDLQEQAKVQALLDQGTNTGLAGRVMQSVFQTASLSVPSPGGATLAVGGLLVMARRRR